MELKIKDGDYVPDGAGGFVRVSGQEALVQRILFRLIAHRGGFPFLEDLGSELYRLGQYPASQRAAMAERAVTEALAPEADLQVQSVTLADSSGAVEVAVELVYQGEDLAVSVTVQ